MKQKSYYVIRKKGTELYCENAGSTCKPEVPFSSAHLFTKEDDLDEGDLLEDEEAVSVVLSPGEVIKLPDSRNTSK